MKNKRDEVFQFTKLQPTCKTEGFLGNLHGTMKNASLNFSQYIFALKKLLVQGFHGEKYPSQSLEGNQKIRAM